VGSLERGTGSLTQKSAKQKNSGLECPELVPADRPLFFVAD